jgi:DNA-binding Xre family transcriptional regulator
MRRKGEKPVVKSWPPYNAQHPVANMIASGDRWIAAWRFQSNLPMAKLAKVTGISMGRLFAMEHGDYVTYKEIEGLAEAWQCDPADIIASLPDPALLVK